MHNLEGKRPHAAAGFELKGVVGKGDTVAVMLPNTNAMFNATSACR